MSDQKSISPVSKPVSDASLDDILASLEQQLDSPAPTTTMSSVSPKIDTSVVIPDSPSMQESHPPTTVDSISTPESVISAPPTPVIPEPVSFNVDEKPVDPIAPYTPPTVTVSHQALQETPRFNADVKDAVPPNSLPVQPPASQPPSNGFKPRFSFKPKVLVAGLAFVLLLAGSGAAFVLSTQNQSLIQKAATIDECRAQDKCESAGACWDRDYLANVNGTCYRCGGSSGWGSPVSCDGGINPTPPATTPWEYAENGRCIKVNSGYTVTIQRFNGPSCPTTTSSLGTESVGAGTWCPTPPQGACQQLDVVGSDQGVCSCDSSTPTPTPTATPAGPVCNSTCSPNSENACCPDGQTSCTSSPYSCTLVSGNGSVSGSDYRCRLTENPTSATCVAPTPTPTPTATPVGAVCINITKDVATPEIGDQVRFTCGQVTTATRYEFRYSINDEIVPLLPIAATSNISQPLTITEGGTFAAQCRPCVGEACAEWEEF